MAFEFCRPLLATGSCFTIDPVVAGTQRKRDPQAPKHSSRPRPFELTQCNAPSDPMPQTARTVKNRYCVLLGGCLGVAWLIGVFGIFSVVRDPVFGDWNGGDAGTLVVVANVLAYLLTCPLIAMAIPSMCSGRFRNLKALCLLALSSLVPVAVATALLLGFGNLAGLAR